MMTLEAIQDYLEFTAFYPTVNVHIAAGGDLSTKDFYVCEFGRKWTCINYDCENGKAEFYCDDLKACLYGVIKTKQTYLGEIFNFIISCADSCI
jgi:hypothetical protein